MNSPNNVNLVGKLFRVTQEVEWWTTVRNRRSDEYPTVGLIKPGELLLCVDYEESSFALLLTPTGEYLNIPLVRVRKDFPIDKWEYIEALLMSAEETPTTKSWRRRFVYRWLVEFLELAFPV